MKLQDNDPKVKLNGIGAEPTDYKILEQTVVELKAAARAAEDEGNWHKADGLWDQVYAIQDKLTSAKRLAALPPEKRTAGLEWRARFAAQCKACCERGEQWFFDGPNMIHVVPPEEVDEGRSKAAWLAHRARPGPAISDDQLFAAARVFINRFRASDRKDPVNWAKREIRHCARQLTPHGLDWKPNLMEALRDIPQGNRREFLEELALCKRDLTASVNEPNEVDDEPLDCFTVGDLFNELESRP